MVVVFLVAALVLGTATGSNRPQLSVPDQRPFTVDGTGFRSSERIRVTVRALNRVTRIVTAGSAGRFEVRMRAVKLGTCPAFAIRAIGSQGSRATLKIIPVCANLQPVDR
jgi:hypothetical protein